MADMKITQMPARVNTVYRVAFSHIRLIGFWVVDPDRVASDLLAGSDSENNHFGSRSGQLRIRNNLK
jgi:hypothetical protein